MFASPPTSPQREKKAAALYGICFGIGLVVGFLQDLAGLFVKFMSVAMVQRASSLDMTKVDSISILWDICSAVLLTVTCFLLRTLGSDRVSHGLSADYKVVVAFYGGAFCGLRVSWLVAGILMGQIGIDHPVPGGLQYFVFSVGLLSFCGVAEMQCRNRAHKKREEETQSSEGDLYAKEDRAKRFGTESPEKGTNKHQKIVGDTELSQEEIEKRLARAKKYNISSDETKKLKAMARKKRFAMK